MFLFDIFFSAVGAGRTGAPSSSSPTAATAQKLQVASGCNVRRKLILLNRWQFPEKNQLAARQTVGGPRPDHGMGVKKSVESVAPAAVCLFATRTTSWLIMRSR